MANAPRMGIWTDQRIAMLKKHHANGVSCSDSAAMLGGGITRNAVIGKRMRLGLATPGGTVAGKALQMTRERIAARGAKAPEVKRQPHLNAGLNFRTAATAPSMPPRVWTPKPVEVPAAADPKRICDEGFGGCRWPLAGVGADLLHCCAPIAQDPGQPRRVYCAVHERAAWGGKGANLEGLAA